jgi:hypothetical protein
MNHKLDTWYVISVLLFTVFSILVGLYFESYACDIRWPDREHKFTARGCMVKSGDFFVPEDRLRFYDYGVST